MCVDISDFFLMNLHAYGALTHEIIIEKNAIILKPYVKTISDTQNLIKISGEKEKKTINS